MRTFSEIIDATLAITLLPHQREYTIAQANIIIKDLASMRDSSFDLVELSIPVTESAYAPHTSFPSNPNLTNYRIPRVSRPSTKFQLPTDFRKIQAVRYDGDFFAPMIKPSLAQKQATRFWYQSGHTLCFAGARHSIDIAYYRSQRMFRYYPADKRLVRSNLEDQYEFRKNVDDPVWHPVDLTQAESSRTFKRHVNWVIDEYPELVMTGTASRVFNAVGKLAEGARLHNQYKSDKNIAFRSQGHVGSANL